MNQLFTDEQNHLFKHSIDVYGFYAQLDQVQEEAIELALAIRKYKRAIDNKVYIEPGEVNKRTVELISEIADVIIMTQQCRHLFSDEEIQKEINRKLERQKGRISAKLAEKSPLTQEINGYILDAVKDIIIPEGVNEIELQVGNRTVIIKK